MQSEKAEKSKMDIRVVIHVGRAQSAPGAISLETVIQNRRRGPMFDTDYGAVEWPVAMSLGDFL